MVIGTVVIELFLAVMLTVAGVSKLIDHVAFQQSLRAFHIPGPSVRPVSFALPIVLTFGDTSGGRCHNLAPDLAQWQQKYADRLTIVSIVTGEPLEVEELVRASGLQNVLLEGQEDIAGRFGVDIVPAMLFIGRDNRIESFAALREDAVRALWWRQLVATNSRDLQPTRLHAVLAEATAR